jgi:hypothetical protein
VPGKKMMNKFISFTFSKMQLGRNKMTSLALLFYAALLNGRDALMKTEKERFF